MSKDTNVKDAGENNAVTPNAKKNKVIIDINPTLESVDLLKFDTTAVVSFLKMSPPSLEHDAFVDRLYDLATGHSVENPMVFIDSSDDIQSVTSAGEGSDDEQDTFFLAPEDAKFFALEAYGDLVQTETFNSLYSLTEFLSGKFTHLVVVLPADVAARYGEMLAERGVEVVSDSLDETSISRRMYGHVDAKDYDAFYNGLSVGVDYLADDMIELYDLFTVETTDDLDEALTYGQRLKRAQVFRRNKRKIMVARARMRKKVASTDQLKTRARHKAIQAIRKKVAGAKGIDYNNLSVGEKIQIDKRVEQRKGAIGRIAAKILPSIRKAELQKLSKRNASMHKEGVNLSELPNNMAEPLHDKGESTPVKTGKKFHQMFTKEGKVKLDQRFKIWRSVNSIDEALETISELVESKDTQKLLEALITKAEEYNVEPDVIRELFDRGVDGGDDETAIQEGFNRVNSFLAGSYFMEDLELMERAEAGACAIITKEDLKELEKFGDALLDKFGIDIEFTKHFNERMSDDRNNPCITVKEVREIFRKLAMKQGKDIKNAPDTQVVLKDIQKSLNIPIVIDYNRGEFEVKLKTIMRKKDFLSSSPTVRV